MLNQKPEVNEEYVGIPTFLFSFFFFFLLFSLSFLFLSFCLFLFHFILFYFLIFSYISTANTFVRCEKSSLPPTNHSTLQ